MDNRGGNGNGFKGGSAYYGMFRNAIVSQEELTYSLLENSMKGRWKRLWRSIDHHRVPKFKR
ncbi:unnamed protein product [Prunus brigantina]